MPRTAPGFMAIVVVLIVFFTFLGAWIYGGNSQAKSPLEETARLPQNPTIEPSLPPSQSGRIPRVIVSKETEPEVKSQAEIEVAQLRGEIAQLKMEFVEMRNLMRALVATVPPKKEQGSLKDSVPSLVKDSVPSKVAFQLPALSHTQEPALHGAGIPPGLGNHQVSPDPVRPSVPQGTEGESQPSPLIVNRAYYQIPPAMVSPAPFAMANPVDPGMPFPPTICPPGTERSTVGLVEKAMVGSTFPRYVQVAIPNWITNGSPNEKSFSGASTYQTYPVLSPSTGYPLPGPSCSNPNEGFYQGAQWVYGSSPFVMSGFPYSAGNSYWANNPNGTASYSLIPYLGNPALGHLAMMPGYAGRGAYSFYAAPGFCVPVATTSWSSGATTCGSDFPPGRPSHGVSGSEDQKIGKILEKVDRLEKYFGLHTPGSDSTTQRNQGPFNPAQTTPAPAFNR